MPNFAVRPADRIDFVMRNHFEIDRSRCAFPAADAIGTPQTQPLLLQCFLLHTCKAFRCNRLRTLLRNGDCVSALISSACALFRSSRGVGRYILHAVRRAFKSFVICFAQNSRKARLETLFIPVAACLLLSSTRLSAQEPIKTLQPSRSGTRDFGGLDPVLTQANTFLQQGKPTDAEPLLRDYLAHHPDSADAHFLLGSILFREVQESASIGSSPSGVKEERAKASLAEFNVGAKYGKPSASDLKIVSLDYVLLGDYPDADKWLTKMLESASDDSEAWYYLGRTKYNENRFDEAVHAFEQCLKLDPQNVKAEDNLGLAYAGLNRVNDAVAAYHAAIEWQKDSPTKNPGPFIDLADLLLDQNRPNEAIQYLGEAIEISPQDSKAHELLGKACARLDRFPEAQAELEKAAELAPQNANLPCMLGPMYRKQGLTEKAKLALDRCASLNGTHSSSEKPRP
jgi:tetratricopeptide (TPR) repeat protein